MDKPKPRRQVRWRGSRKTLSREILAGTAESKAAVLNEAINLPAWMESPTGQTWEDPRKKDDDIPFPEF